MMRILLLIFIFSSQLHAAQTCDLSFFQGDDLVKTKSYELGETLGKRQIFEKVSPKYFESRENKLKSIKYSVTTYIEFNGNKILFADFIIHRNVEEYKKNKLSASLFSQIKSSYPLERLSLRLDKGLGKKTYLIDSEKTLELSCKNT